MAATINGSLRTWYGTDLSSRDPILRIIPHGVGIGTAGIYARVEKDVTEFGDGGRFSVPLESTLDKRGDCYYTFEIHYYTVDGQPVKIDYPELIIRIPDNGTYEWGEVVVGVGSPFMVWISLSPPEVTEGVVWWLQTNPNNIEDPQNTGLLRKQRY